MNKKEYSVKINGLEENLKGVESLRSVLEKLDKTIVESNRIASENTRATKEKTKALTEEEKAAKQLQQTRDKISRLDKDSVRDQIRLTQQLRERTREVSRQVAQEDLAEGSIRAMGMALTDLRNQYESLSKAERESEETGGALIAQIQTLDEEYKALRESTGNFRDSVGNYEKGLGGLQKLADGLDKVDNVANGVATTIQGGTSIMQLFGVAAIASADSQEKLAKVMLALTIVQQLSNAGLRETIKNGVLSNVIDQVKIVQTNAKTMAQTLSNSTTWAGVAAQRAFNLVASANPYVLLALALVSLVAVLYTFVTETDKSAESQKKLNDAQKVWLDYLEIESERIKSVSNERVKALERQLKILNAQEGKTKEIRAVEDEILKERRRNNNLMLGFYAEEVAALGKNTTELQKYQDMLNKVQQAKARGADKITVDIDLNGKAEKVDVEKAIETIQGKVDNLGRLVQIGVELKTDQADLRAEEAENAARRKKEDVEEAKRRAEEAKKKRDEAKQNARDRASEELEAARLLQDTLDKLDSDGFEKRRKAVNTEYARQIQDIRTRLKNEEKLTAQAREDLNQTIVELEKVRINEIAKIDKEAKIKLLEDTNALEEQRIQLIQGSLRRQASEINLNYDNQKAALGEQLAALGKLETDHQIVLRDRIENIEKLRARDIEALAIEQINRRAALELATLEENYKKNSERLGEIVRRNPSGFIDVDATKKAADEQATITAGYFRDLVQYQNQLEQAGKRTLQSLKEGTVEYDEEVQKQATAHADVDRKIAALLKKRTADEKDASRVVLEYWREVFDRISMYASAASEVVTGATDTVSMAIQFALDSLNEQLEVLNGFYDEAQKRTEEYTKNVETAEQRLQSATGGTAEALREQLQNSMQLRNEAQREEARLAKEKEKVEEQIRKREKQQKRAELIGNIGMGIANTAQGVTKALGSLPPPLSIVMAAIVGALGLVQVGIMTRQLTKLAKGGPIDGPSHSGGGVDININGRPSYEAEGGEFMINRASVAANPGLIEFINDNPRTLNFADLINAPGLDFGAVASDNSDAGNPIVEAIEAIEIQPVVSVVDIIDATAQRTNVEDISGF